MSLRSSAPTPPCPRHSFAPAPEWPRDSSRPSTRHALISLALGLVLHAFLIPRDVMALPPEPPAQRLAPSPSNFGFDLWRAASKDQPGNFALSPASLTSLFEMVHAATAGETASELARALTPGTQPGATLPLVAWHQPHTAYRLVVENRLFADPTLTLHDPFLAWLDTAFGAAVDRVDFRDPLTPNRINTWVETATDHHIREFIGPRMLGAKTRFLFLNTTFFKGTWLDAFDPDATYEHTFHTPDGPRPAHFMKRKLYARHARTTELQLLQLPYAGGHFAMLFVLPLGDLPTVEAGLDHTRLAAWVDSLRPVEVDVHLPRFRIETPTLDLRSLLGALGVTRAFNPGADFSAMTSTRVHLTLAFHKVVIEVDEAGTRAAAITASGGVIEALEPTPTFRANRPFLFFLRDTRSGHVLFLGRMVAPGMTMAAPGPSPGASEDVLR